MAPEELGKTIREARRMAGLTQAQVAAAAGVGLRFLIELEAGKPTARLGKTLAVLTILACRLRIDVPPKIAAW